MDRRAVLQSIQPLSGKPVSVPDISRGFSNLSDLDDGVLPGQPTPSDPEPKPRTPHDQKAMFERLFKEQKLSLDELSPYRVRTGWRAIRWIMVKLGLLHPDLLIGELPEKPGDPANGLDAFNRPLSIDMLNPPSPDRATRKLVEIIRQAGDSCPPMQFDALHPSEDRIIRVEKPGVSLLPTPENADFWVYLIEIASENLYLRRGSKEDPDQGRYGLLGLTDPKTAPIACPLVPELEMWEVFLVDETMRLYTSTGDHQIHTALRDHYALLPGETQPILAHARRHLRDSVNLDVEEHRVLMVLRLQDVVERAKNALDPRAEMMGLKLLMQTVGLTRAEPEDMKAMFKKIVMAANKDKKSLDYTEPPRQLESIADVAHQVTTEGQTHARTNT